MKSENSKKVPKLFENKKNCCGCSACFSICPQHAINMEADKEGFLYPKIDIEKCIGCNKCLSVCVFKKSQKNKKIF